MFSPEDGRGRPNLAAPLCGAARYGRPIIGAAHMRQPALAKGRPPHHWGCSQWVPPPVCKKNTFFFLFSFYFKNSFDILDIIFFLNNLL